MKPRPTHLRHKGKPACGEGQFCTSNVIKVTCGNCKQTIQYADALILNGRGRKGERP